MHSKSYFLKYSQTSQKKVYDKENWHTPRFVREVRIWREFIDNNN